MPNFEKTARPQLVQSWMMLKYDYQWYKNLFAKCSKKQSYCEYHSQGQL